MNDRFKFRVWDKDRKKMFECMQISFSEHAHGSCAVKDNETSIHLKYQPSLVLMQYIGLSDKSRKPIYEGDIVSDGHYNMEVYFDKTYVRFAAKKYSTYARKKYGAGSYEVCFFMDRSEDGKDTWYKVVGNIYENKELLENVKSSK